MAYGKSEEVAFSRLSSDERFQKRLRSAVSYGDAGSWIPTASKCCKEDLGPGQYALRMHAPPTNSHNALRIMLILFRPDAKYLTLIDILPLVIMSSR